MTIITYIKHHTSREVLSIFKKLYIYSKKYGTVNKRKSSVKDVIIDQIRLEYLANLLYNNFFWKFSISIAPLL